MFSKEGNLELIKDILDEKTFANMTEEELLSNINLIKQHLDELKDEYAFRVHMENGLESYYDLSDKINRYIKVYKYLLNLKELIDQDIYLDNINVKDLSDNEEYKEKYLLNIPNIVIPLKEKSKTR